MRSIHLLPPTLIVLGVSLFGCSAHAPHIADNHTAVRTTRRPPAIKNEISAARIVARHYPEALKTAGIGGQVDLYIFVDIDGWVKNARVRRSSGNVELDQAALAAVREIEFIPARNEQGNIVPVWISIPIAFSVAP